MMDKIAAMLSWRGEIGRIAYLSLGCLLFAIKTHVDRYIPYLLGQKDIFAFSPMGYVYGPLPNLDVLGNREYFLTLLWIALPFIYLGVCLTVKRLRSTGLHQGLVALFFVPFVNILLFVILSFLESKQNLVDTKSGRGMPFYSKYIPRTKFASALMGCLVTALLSLLLSVIVIYWLGQYGWSLFVGVPFCAGLISCLFYGYHQPRPLKENMGVAVMAGLLLGVGFLLLSLEGFICVIMASPLLGVIAMIGGMAAYFIQLRNTTDRDFTKATLPVLLFLPISATVGQGVEPPPAKVITILEIDAPAEIVWDNLIAFPPIPEERSWLFYTGIAYPTHAVIEGEGQGSIRYCHFSTGPFVEPIDIWQKPRRLSFHVTERPDPMKEMALYGEVHPPHLTNSLRTERGEFLIEPIKDGRIRLIGTTWYHQDLWPNPYWRLWTNWIIHKIHLRVMNHIKTLSEQSITGSKYD